MWEKYGIARQAAGDSIMRRRKDAIYHSETLSQGYRSTFRIFDDAFPLQQWLCENALMLHYTYIVCLLSFFYFLRYLEIS